MEHTEKCKRCKFDSGGSKQANKSGRGMGLFATCDLAFLSPNRVDIFEKFSLSPRGGALVVLSHSNGILDLTMFYFY